MVSVLPVPLISSHSFLRVQQSLAVEDVRGCWIENELLDQPHIMTKSLSLDFDSSSYELMQAVILTGNSTSILL